MIKLDKKGFCRYSNYDELYPDMKKAYSKLPDKNKISDLWKILEGQKIKNPDTAYIFGTGPSIFSITNKKYYENRMTIGINYSYEILPFIKYICCGEIQTYNRIIKKIDNSKLIHPIAMNHNKRSDREIIINEKSHHYMIQDPRKRLHQMKLGLDKDIEMLCYSTTTHSAIHIAAYMGAKKIYLIGCDYIPYKDGKIHFKSKHGGKLYNNQDWHALRKHRMGEVWLKEKLKLFYNIELYNLNRNMVNGG